MRESSILFQEKVMPGEKAGTTRLTVSVRQGNHLAVKVSATPVEGDVLPTDRTVTNPYTPGSDITGVDSEINKYVALYELDSEEQILNFKMITLTEVEIQPEQWTMVWEETFSGDQIDESRWNFVDGGHGFGNDEHQYYTGRPCNARIEDGQLVIEAHKEQYEENPYTSAKLTTQGKFDWTYGRFTFRAKLPEGQGIWPAIWMMPSDMERFSGWPSCGEIDIMEIVGHEPGTVHGTLHYGLPHTYTGEKYTLPNNKKFSDDFHVFTLDWEPGEFRWYIDGVLYAKQNKWFTSEAAFPAPFNREFYLQLNLAVGGKWPGYPDETTVFPQRMIVDYIQVFQKA